MNLLKLQCLDEGPCSQVKRRKLYSICTDSAGTVESEKGGVINYSIFNF